MLELHTGASAIASLDGGEEEFVSLQRAAGLAHELGLTVNAGHGITLTNLPKLMRISNLAELNVGHHLIARGLFRGLSGAVRDMRTMMDAYPMVQEQVASAT